MEQESKKILLKILGETNYLGKIRAFITNIASEAGFNEEDLYKIESAVDEACTNVIEHAYNKNEEAKPLTLRLEVTPTRLIISVTDYGKGFVMDSIKPPNISKFIAEKKDGGLGLFLIKSFMDEISYQSDSNGHNKLTMIKYLKPK
jgi:serine/threonine-protein kinase RsbW